MALAIILLIFIVYFSFSRATVTLTLSDESKTEKVDLMVSTAQATGDLVGKISSKELNLSQKFTTEKYTEKPGLAKGMMKIINNHTANQSLVRTTRFLSSTGVLFRLSETLVVSAGKSITAEVYADQAGASGNVAAGKFTIPGLSNALQAKIYGETEKPMTGGVQKVGVLSQSDIDKGKETFLSVLDEKIKQALAKEIKLEENQVALLGKEVQKIETLEKLGQEVSEFTLTAKVLVKIVVVDSEELVKIAKEKYKIKLKDLEIVSWQEGGFNFQIESSDEKTGQAMVVAEITAQVAGSFEMAKFNRKDIVGFDRKGVEYYFSQYPGIKSVEVKFSPFWVRSVPALEDRIEIVIK